MPIRQRLLMMLNDDVESFTPKLSSSVNSDMGDTSTAVDDLVTHITATLNHIQKSHPKKLVKKGFWDRLLGKSLERQLEFELAKKFLTNSSVKGDELYNQVKVVKESRLLQLTDLKSDCEQVELYIDVLNEYMANNTVADDKALRLKRRLDNLTATKVNLMLNVEQVKLSLVPITQVLDRYQEINLTLNVYLKHLAQYNLSSDLDLNKLEQEYSKIFGS